MKKQSNLDKKKVNFQSKKKEQLNKVIMKETYLETDQKVVERVLENMDSHQQAIFLKLYQNKDPTSLYLLNQFKNQELSFNSLVEKLITLVDSLLA